MYYHDVLLLHGPRLSFRLGTPRIHPPILEDMHIMTQSETTVPRKTLSMRGLFDELLSFLVL
jgi:hypothetical protein